MFKFTIESSHVVKKVTIEFGDEEGTMDFSSIRPSSDPIAPASTDRSPSDISDVLINRIANSVVTAKTPEKTPIVTGKQIGRAHV